ncbi:nuclear transport factor 2 family protein, partial [Mycobacterium tuberculosis]
MQMSASNAFVEGFADFWKAPSPDRLTDHLHPDVVLVRP